jgi:hypothetical protein
VLHRVSSLRANGAVVLSNKDCCEGSCVHQELSSSGLRRGDLYHIACWIRSSSSGDVLRVIGRFLSGWLAVKDRDKTPTITGVILITLFFLIHLYSTQQFACARFKWYIAIKILPGCIKYVVNTYEFIYAYMCPCICFNIVKYHDRDLWNICNQLAAIIV